MLCLALAAPAAGDIAYVTNQNGSTLSLVDLQTASQVRQTALPGEPAGIAVVPLEWAEDMLAASKEKLAQELDTLKQITEGKTTAELLGIDEPEMIN